MKRRFLIISSIVLMFVCLVWLFQTSFHQSDLVVTINGIAVSEPEFRLHLNRNIAKTHSHFFQEWGANDHADFWQTTYGGQTPLEYIKKVTLEQLVDIKAKQRLAVSMGLIPEFDYETCLKWWVQDNADRKAKHEAGGIVYGPLENSLGNYYDYLFSNLFIKLQNKLNQIRFNANNSELEYYFEQHKEKWFQYTPEVEVEYIEFIYRGSSERQEALKEADLLKESLIEGVDMKSLKVNFNPIQYKHQVFSITEEITGEDNPDHQRQEMALDLDAGEMKVLDGYENSSIYLMQCLSKSEDKIYPFDKVIKDVRWYYQLEKNAQLMDSLVHNAQVKINDSKLKSIKI